MRGMLQRERVRPSHLWAPLKYPKLYKATEIVLPGMVTESTAAKAAPDVDRPMVRDWSCNCWISRSKIDNGTDVTTLQHAVRCRSLYAEKTEDGKSGTPVSCLGGIAPPSKPANYVELEWLDELVCADTE
jgi:hypothetical protein